MFGFLLSSYKQPELVNKLFQRLDDGIFRVQKDTNSFHQWRKIYEQNIAKDKKAFSWRQDGHGCLFVKWRVGSRCCHCHVRSRGVNHRIIEVIGFYHVVLFFIQVFFLRLLYTQDLSHGYWIPKMMVFMASF